MKTIIIFATKHGCTEKTAHMLKTKLQGDVTVVNIRKEKVPAIENFDTVILGGSVYMGKIQKELANYICEYLPTLLKKRIGLFICAGSPNTEERKKEIESVFPEELTKHALSRELFGYELNFDKMGLFEKMITKAMKGDTKNVSEINEAGIEKLAKIMSGISINI